MIAAQTLLSLLPADRVRVHLDAPTKPDVLRAMVELAACSDAVRDLPQLLADVQAREALISTGVGQGLALPHARTSAVTETVAAFATLKGPVDYQSLDGAPVRMVLLLAGPERERSRHLRLLSRVSRLMANAATREQLLSAFSAHAILDVLGEAEEHLK